MKKTLKEIREELRKEISKQYKAQYEDKIIYLKEELKRTNNSLSDKLTKLSILKQENEELKDKLHQYEDWITRLQSWCDLPEDERIEAIKNYQTQNHLNSVLNNLINRYNKFFNFI